MEYVREISALSPACKTFWYLSHRKLGSRTTSVSTREVLKCKLLEALKALRQKDTFPLHIWGILLWGAALVLGCKMNALTDAAYKLLRPGAFMLHKETKTDCRAPAQSPSYCITSDVLKKYLLSLSSQISLHKSQFSCEIDMVDTKTLSLDMGRMDIFGPQNDFELAIGVEGNSEQESLRLGTPVCDNAQFHAGNETTVRKKGRKVADLTCCVRENYLRSWMTETSEITTWRMKAPPQPSSKAFLSLQLSEILNNFRKEQCGNLQYDKEEHKESEGDEDYRLIPVSVLGCDLQGPSDLISRNTPMTVNPVRTELVLPLSEQYQFSEVQCANPAMKRATVFIRLLEMSKAGIIELQQSFEFSDIRIVCC